jgi:hypothetical protein
VRATRRELTKQLGGELTPAQRALVERISMLHLRCAVLDERLADGTFTMNDGRQYLAFTNALRRALKDLGLNEQIPPPADPMDALKAHVASRRREDAA